MAKKPLTPEMNALHKKLWPANIVICIVAFVAAVCMFLMPWLDLRVQIHGEKLATAITETIEEGDDENDGSTLDQDTKDSITEMLAEVEFEIPLNVYPLKLLAASTGSKTELADFFNSLIGKDGVESYIDYLAEELVPAVVEGAINIAIDEVLASELEGELTDDEQAYMDRYAEQAKAIVSTLTSKSNTSATDAKAQFVVLINEVNENGLGNNGGDNLFTEEELNDVINTFNEIVDAGTPDETPEKFDIVYTIDHIGDIIAKASDSNPEDYADIQEYIDTIKSPGKMIVDEMTQDTQDLVQLILLIVFLVFIALPAFFWALLGLCALVRIFTKRKRVKMWYVKFFCFWAGFFVLLFNVAFLLLPNILGWVGVEDKAITSMLEAFSIKFLGSGVVTGICWVILVLLGWFFYNRVKKRIKRLKKAEKQAAKVGVTAREYLVNKYSQKAIKAKCDPEEYFEKKKAKKYGLKKKAMQATAPVAPVEEVKAEEPVAPIAPVEEVKTEEPVAPIAPVEEVKAEEVKAEEAFAEVPAETPATPVEEVKTEEPVAPVEEVKTEEPVAPVEEAKAEEPVAPVEEAKAEETKVETAAKTPATKKPAAKKTTATATKSTATKTTAKSTATKSTAAKATATKSTTAKTTATKTTTAKSTATKSTAAKTTATKSTTVNRTAAKPATKTASKTPVREATKITKTTPKK